MAMVHIGHMRVLVRQRRMPVQVRVRLADRPVMLVDVVLVVDVSVIVLECLVRVNVLVSGSQEHDDTGRHGRHREDLACAEPLPEQSCRNERADEGSGREVRGLPRGAQQAERPHCKHDAHAVAEEPEHHPVSHLP